ncbi:MAG: D-alanine--poly(phosphoribitol) ligase [Phycisphaerae bacterium]|nr:MAG: amino acid adenylation domain-containing protein [Planctomycetia bacterium]GJQ25530.1 MAG: D-alanine--poly(phosphoribitol) ligase [Phycisphaerae bacterium]
MTQTLFTLLEAAAARYGDRPAVCYEGRTLGYAALLDASSRLAEALADSGAGPGEQVAFCFRKSIDAIVTMFALIRTGACYVPLDPAWPAERMAMICEDASIRLWTGSGPPAAGLGGIDRAICSSLAGAGSASGSGTTVDAGRASGGGSGSVSIMTLSDAMQAAPPAWAPREPAGGIANLLFTSGSTGRPKGVRITTLSLLHYSQWVVDFFGLTAEDRVANHAPYNFDLSTLDIFAAVRAGAAMVPVPEKLKMFPYQMAKYIADERITTWYSVPSALIMMQLRGKLREHDLSALRHVIFAGEVMPKPALQAIAAELPPVTLTNLYGPTETNVCTYHACTAADLADDGPVPIGKPISDTRVWIVDDAMRPVPAGDAGELLVAGPTVTSGYFGDAVKTAERLVPAPDGDGTAYRTGDRVRARADGVLMFEGRIDRMIKARGHRIEPGEIEAALAKHPAVKESAVVPIPDPVFGNRIKACLAPRDGASLVEADLAAFCRAHLPPYMLPDVWAFYPSLPRTDREKIDLQQLMST